MHLQQRQCSARVIYITFWYYFRNRYIWYCVHFRGGWPEVMRKATLPKVERVNRLEGQHKGSFLDVMMGEVFSPRHFYIQVPQSKTICKSANHLFGCFTVERSWLKDARIRIGRFGWQHGRHLQQALRPGPPHSPGGGDGESSFLHQSNCDIESVLQQEDMHCAVNIPSEKNSKWYRAVISALDGSAVQVLDQVLAET